MFKIAKKITIALFHYVKGIARAFIANRTIEFQTQTKVVFRPANESTLAPLGTTERREQLSQLKGEVLTMLRENTLEKRRLRGLKG